MWLCTNYGFFSVVKILDLYVHFGDNKPDEIYAVRARIKDHLSKGFPNKPIFKYDNSDYEYRVYITPLELQEFLNKEISNITYTNFKNSVKCPILHDFFSSIWGLGVKYLSNKGRFHETI